MKVRTTMAMLLAVGMLVSISACGGASQSASGSSASAGTPKFSLVHPGQLTVATYGTSLPVISVGPGNKLGALDGKWITAFAKAQHLKLNLYETNFASVILAVEQHKVDVGTFYYYTPQRAQQVFYTYPFYASVASVYTKKSFHYTGPSSLNGKTVGSTVGVVWVPYLQKALGSSLKTYPTQTEGETALLNGQVDAFVVSSDSLYNPPFSGRKDITRHLLSAGDFGISQALIANQSYNIVACDNQPLAKAMNSSLKSLHNDGSWKKLATQYKLTKQGQPALESPKQGCA